MTGIGTYGGNVKWIALAASITMILGSIILLLWQNAASKLQEHYKVWTAIVKIRNATVNINNPKRYDWIAYIEACNKFNDDYKKWISNAKEINKWHDKSNGQKYDWATYVLYCAKKNTDGIKENIDEYYEFPHYSKKHLIWVSVSCCICLLISVGLMIWSFI